MLKFKDYLNKPTEFNEQYEEEDIEDLCYRFFDEIETNPEIKNLFNKLQKEIKKCITEKLNKTEYKEKVEQFYDSMSENLVSMQPEDIHSLTLTIYNILYKYI